MADKKISELTSITGANVSDANDTIAIVDSSAGQTKKITREELFKDVGGADFTGSVTLGGGQNYLGATNSSALYFNRTDGSSYINFGRVGDVGLIFRDGNNDTVARVEEPGTSAPHTKTLMTREKGDARYARLDGQQLIDSDDVTDFKVGRSSNQHIAFWGTSARNNIESVSQAGAGKNLGLSVTNPDSTPTLSINLNSTEAARFTPTLSSGTSVVNRDTGDARYLPERGSNANGEYVRFPDGTQICTHSITTSASATVAWTFPATFNNTDYRVSAIGRTGTSARTSTISGKTTSDLDFSGWDTSGARVSTGFDLIAIGTWS